MKRLFATLCILLVLAGCGGKQPVSEQTDVEKFAEKHSISVALAQSVEDALSQADIPATLNALNDWEQSEDYADGQRYTGWFYSNSRERYYYMVFYVQEDRVESIRDQQNGLEFLYQKES